MHRFYLADLTNTSGCIALTGDEAAHAVRVLRIRRGEEVTVLNGRGLTLSARVLNTSRQRIELEPLELHRAEPTCCPITLFQAITKPASMELIVQKATELGVAVIQPVISQHVVARIDQTDAIRKANKWQRIAIEAMKQSGAPWLPSVAPARALTSLVPTQPQGAKWLVGSLRSDAPSLRHWSSEWKGSPPGSLGVWIGPEGDFTSVELDALTKAGARPFTMGSNVLRSETAALWALAVLGYEVAATLPQPGTNRG